MRRVGVVTLVMGALIALPALGGTVSGVAECKGGCENVVAYLDGLPPEGGGEDTVVFDQKNKVFVPHLLAIVQDTTVDITNGDDFLHHVHIYDGKKTVLNLAMPFPGQVYQHTFEELGTFKVLCDAHPEMSAWIVVRPNRFFAVPTAEGSFEIADVPSGTYTLVVENAEKETRKESEVVVN